MGTADVVVLVLYFIGLIVVSFIVSKKIKSSEDMFIAGRNSSWWLSGISSYMTIFSASTFVVWGGVAYKSGITAVAVAICLGIASFFVGRFIAAKWRQLKIKSPGEFLTIRFKQYTLNFYTIVGIIARSIHTAVSVYAVSIIMCTLISIPADSPFAFMASSGAFGDSEAGHLSIWAALLILGVIALVYTVLGGFLAVLMTDVVQFGVLIAVVIFIIPLSIKAGGGIDQILTNAANIPGFLDPTSEDYTWIWLALWIVLNTGMIGGDWPFVQRYISVPTAKDAKKSTYLIGALYILTPIIWYLPTMILRTMEPDLGANLDPATLQYYGEHAYVTMSQLVLMESMLGLMLAAMLSATLSCVSGTLNVYANVFTFDVWSKYRNNNKASEKTKIKVGRLFTLFFGLLIIGISLLVPFAGGAENLVVSLLTMVMCPLYIPSIWGLFSKRLTGRQLIGTMVFAWVCAIAGKLFIPADVIPPKIWESLAGCVIPILIMTLSELTAKARGITCPGYEKLWKHTDPEAEKEPSAKMKKATKEYSLMAINFFLLTLGAIVLLLLYSFATNNPKTLESADIVIGFIIGICALIVIYIIYRIVDKKKNKNK